MSASRNKFCLTHGASRRRQRGKQQPSTSKQMTLTDYTLICSAIAQKVFRTLPVPIRLRLKPDRHASYDKPRRKKTLKFCITGPPNGCFWNRDYSSYHIVYDPLQELHQKGTVQVRFMFFLNRKETGKGCFNKSVKQILYHLAGQKSFTFVINDEIALLYRPYFSRNLRNGWQKAAAKDLAWLIKKTFIPFDNLRKA
jgi:hypothetical protein